MRAPFALLLLVALLLPLAPAGAHTPADCRPQRGFPSADGRFMQPGQVATYYVPPSQFITVTAGGPIDVSLVTWGTCEASGCDAHAMTGTLACATDVLAAVEIANRGIEPALVVLVIGVCSHPLVCSSF